MTTHHSPVERHPDDEAGDQVELDASSSGLRRLIARFAADHPDLGLADSARDPCIAASDAFARTCWSAGLDAEAIHGVEMGEFLGHPVVLNGHTAVLVEGPPGHPMVVDWTARQFDPAADFPRVCTTAQWRETWQPLTNPDTETPADREAAR